MRRAARRKGDAVERTGRQPAVVAAGHHLPDLSALVPGRERRRRRRPRRHQAAARLSRRARASTRSGSRRSIPRRWPTSATTSPTTAASIRCSARSPISTRSSPTRMRAASKIILDFVPNHTSDRHPWFLEAARRAATRSATGTSGATPAPDGGPPNNWLSHFGGTGLELRRGDRAVVPALVPARAAGPELAQPRGARGDVRRAALLARPRRRRLPRRRASGY